MAVNYSDIAGHERQKIKLSRLIDNQVLPGTILFTGPSGIGKKLMATRTISSLFCRGENSPCMACHECRRIEEDVHPDYIHIEPNDRGVIPIGSEDRKEYGTVRWIIDRLTTKSFSGIRAALVDGVDRIRVEGQNALLKTIEEPSPGTYIFLVASGTATILPTILSRCFEIKFSPLTGEAIIGVLEKKKLIGGHVSVITEISGGSVENAIILAGDNTLEEVRSACAGMSGFIRGDNSPGAELQALEKKMGTGRLVDILMNVYRQNLLDLVSPSDGGKACRDFFNTVFLEDAERVIKLQKALIEARKAVSRNISLVSAVRGLLFQDMLIARDA